MITIGDYHVIKFSTNHDFGCVHNDLPTQTGYHDVSEKSNEPMGESTIDMLNMREDLHNTKRKVCRRYVKSILRRASD